MKGINVSIFAYGQTCTGKTHTMRGSSTSPGVIPQAISTIFTEVSNLKLDHSYDSKCTLKVNPLNLGLVLRNLQ